GGAEPPSSGLPRRAPGSGVHRLQCAHEHWTCWDGARAERPYGEAPPPDVRLGERTDGGAREAASPVRVHVGPHFIAREPIDLVLLDAVEDHLVPEGNAVGGTVDGALATDLAEVLHAVVDGLVRNKREVGHDRMGNVYERDELHANEEPVAPELPDTL